MNPPDCFELLYYPGRCWGELDRICRDQNKQDIKDKLDEPMPWIGMYIAAASAVCGIAMAADAFNSFKTKQFWFPCKYFSLNATALTLLAVAMKFTLDLSNVKNEGCDYDATVSSLALMSIAISNFMISLATMDNNEIMLNLTALAILIVTIEVNFFLYAIQMNKSGFDGFFVDRATFILCAILPLLLILLCSSAIMVPTTKRYVEYKFREMHKMVSKERLEDRKFTLHELTTVLKKYWVMAITSNPQFVMVRSVVCVLPGCICLSMVLIMILLYDPFQIYESFSEFVATETSYKWSVACIFFLQTVGVAIGAIAPISRWFIVALFRSSNISYRCFNNELKIGTHCTRTLVDWRESPIKLRIRHHKCKKFLHVSKRLLLNVCIGIQILIILVNKLLLILSMGLAAPPLMLFNLVKKLRMRTLRSSNSTGRLESDVDFSPYVLLLEGEPKLPTNAIRNICKEADNLIRIGKRQKPKKIIKLLRKSNTFNGVRELESNEVAISLFQGPPKCWSLAVATLTKIAISVPNIPNHKVNQLLSEVSEGISFVNFIEKTIDANGELTSIRKAADIVWVRPELYREKMQKHKLQDLSDMAKKKVVDFKASTKDPVMENPLNWPPEVIAANLMYRICQTLLLTENQSDELMMFERVSTIVADILAVCLTNLAHALLIKCQSNAIEKREENIRQAAIILGESEELIQFLEQHEWLSLDPEKAGFIEAWRVILEQDAENPVTSSPATSAGMIPETSNGHASVEIGS